MVSNKNKGDEFTKIVKPFLEKKYKIEFEHEKSVDNLLKSHKFDLVSKDGKIVVECKNYSWTKKGNVPSAKISHINEAVLYFCKLPENKTKIIVLAKHIHFTKKESLARYYKRTKDFLLDGIIVMEMNVDEGILEELK